MSSPARSPGGVVAVLVWTMLLGLGAATAAPLLAGHPRPLEAAAVVGWLAGVLGVPSGVALWRTLWTLVATARGSG